MLSKNSKSLIGQILLLSATVLWGTSFAILQDTIDGVSMFYVLAIRFLSSGILMFLLFYKKCVKINLKMFFAGVVLGVFIFLAYLFQTIGLKHTTPGKNAFLTSIYCILIPFILWMITKKKPKPFDVIALIMCVAGVGLISLSKEGERGSFTFLGDGMTLISAIMFALQFVFNQLFNEKKYDVAPMLFIEFLTVGTVMAILSLIIDLPKGITEYALNGRQILNIVYLTLACTLYAQIALIVGQKMTTTGKASIILTLEAVFGALFSVVWGKENMTVYLWLGFGIIFLSIVLSEMINNGLIFKKKVKPDETKKE